MTAKNSKNKRTSILAMILVGLLILAYKIMFMPSDGNLLIEENIVASERMENILTEVESISFDTSISEDQKFKSLKSIETPLISLPIGKTNPFSGIFKSN